MIEQTFSIIRLNFVEKELTLGANIVAGAAAGAAAGVAAAALGA